VSSPLRQVIGSQGNVITRKRNEGVLPCDLNCALFTDHAFKLRTLYVPAGKQIDYNADGTLDFPLGSAIIKAVYYPKASHTDLAYAGVVQRAQGTQGGYARSAGLPVTRGRPVPWCRPKCGQRVGVLGRVPPDGDIWFDSRVNSVCPAGPLTRLSARRNRPA